MDDEQDSYSPEFLLWEEYSEQLEQQVNGDDWDEFLWFSE